MKQAQIDLMRIPEQADEYATERDLYAPMAKTIRDRWTQDYGLERSVVEITAGSGRRIGKWSRPDITVVGRQEYKFVPVRELTVITFEVKHFERLDITAVYEAVAHQRAATAAFLLIYYPRRTWFLQSQIKSDILPEAAERGIGVIVAPEPWNSRTWKNLAPAAFVTPDLRKMDKFIEDVMPDDKQEKIRSWFR